ncbi:MAG: AlpA family transcriptional regulator [Pseudoxanthomonas sp.]
MHAIDITPYSNDTVLRLKSVIEITGLSRSTIYLYIKLGMFPKPIQLGPRAVGWKASEIFLWIASRNRAA